MARTWHHIPQTKRSGERRQEARTTRRETRQSLASAFIGTTYAEAEDLV